MLHALRCIEDVGEVLPDAGGAHDIVWLPDGRTILIVRVHADGTTADATIAGPRTRAQFKHATGIARALVVRFKPGWSASLFGVSAHALTDRMVRLDDLWGAAGERLCRELVLARGSADVLERLARAIAHRAQPELESSSARLARRAARLLEGDEVRVDRVAERLGVTARHLRRAFAASIGVAPKEFARAVRLGRAVRLSASSADWGRIAADAGYFDQAHLIGEFRELVGLTPVAFRNREHARATSHPSS